MDIETVRDWCATFGWYSVDVDDCTLHICPDKQFSLPFLLRVTPNWLLLKIVPAIPPRQDRAALPEDLSRRLLAVNRDLRLAKFATERDGCISLAAELPTELLKPSQLYEIIVRMPRYVDHYREYLGG